MEGVMMMRTVEGSTALVVGTGDTIIEEAVVVIQEAIVVIEETVVVVVVDVVIDFLLVGVVDIVDGVMGVIVVVGVVVGIVVVALLSVVGMIGCGISTLLRRTGWTYRAVLYVIIQSTASIRNGSSCLGHMSWLRWWWL